MTGRLSADLIAEFQKRHLAVFGAAISLETAETELLDLAELIRLTQTITKDNDNGQSNGTEPIYNSRN
jgi:hypothetical protein